MDRVKCRVCGNEKEGCCIVNKNTKVKLNKSRTCKNFVFAMEKVRVKQKLSATMRPDWYWNRKKAIQEYKKNMAAEAIKQQTVSEAPKYLEPTNLDKPDCLANFRSTVSPEDET